MDERTPTPGRRLGDLLIGALFVAAILLPPVAGLVGDESPREELRRPAPRPELRWVAAALRAYPDAFDAWLGDSFGLRGRLIRWHNRAKLLGLGVSPTEELVLGEDGWLFTTRERSVEVYRGMDPFSEADLRVWQRVLEDRREWLARRGALYVFAVAPNKSSVYPERMPARLNRVGPTRLDQLVAWLRRNSDVRILDLREALGVAKRRAGLAGKEIYYPLGTHWNRYGMLAGYWRMLGEVQAHFPAVVPHVLEDFRVEDSAHEGDNWGARLYLEDLLHQTNVELVPRYAPRARLVSREFSDFTPVEVRAVDDPSLPTAVMFHDSFGNMQKDLVAEHFRRTVFCYDPDFDVQLLEAERPDVVLHVLVERALAAHRPAVSPLDDDATLRAAFEASGRVLVDLFPGAGGAGRRAPGPDVVPEPGAAVVWGEDGRGPFCALTAADTAGFLLPEFTAPPDAWPVVRLELEVELDSAALPGRADDGEAEPAHGAVALDFRTREEPTYSLRARSLVERVEPGVDVLWWRLLVPDLSGRLRLRIGEAGSYRLRAFEVRAVPR